MKKTTLVTVKYLFFIIITSSYCFTFNALANEVKLIVKKTSQLPINGLESDGTAANLIGFIGGKGIKNKNGKSRNFLVREKFTFFNAGLNFYIFPNFSSNTNASYKIRNSIEQNNRITALINFLKKRNSKPIYLVGFSRGSVDVANYYSKYNASIKGIILVSGIYKNKSKKAKSFSMGKIFGKQSIERILIVHHKKDACLVSKPSEAHKFFKNISAIKKDFFFFNLGSLTGKKCGPFHHHGYEGIENKVVKKIANWILNQQNKKKQKLD